MTTKIAYLVEGRGKGGDWSTEYVTQDDDNAVTFETIEQAYRFIEHAALEWDRDESNFRVLEVQSCE